MERIISFCFKTILICGLGLCITNCEGEDGAIGAAGENGIDGVDGADGQDGLGFEELTAYGSITISLDGTGPDGEPFNDTAAFKYVMNPTSDSFLNPNPEYIFALTRYLYPANKDNNVVSMIIRSDIAGQSIEDVTLIGITLRDYRVITNELDYFSLELENTFSTPTELTSGISDYSFNDDANRLTFSFAFESAADENSTGNALAVTGEVDLTVISQLQLP